MLDGIARNFLENNGCKISWQSLENWLTGYRKANFHFGLSSTVGQTIALPVLLRKTNKTIKLLLAYNVGFYVPGRGILTPKRSIDMNNKCHIVCIIHGAGGICGHRIRRGLFSILKLCLATATHNFKWVNYSYLFNFRSNICKSSCLNTHFVPNNSDLFDW